MQKPLDRLKGGEEAATQPAGVGLRWDRQLLSGPSAIRVSLTVKSHDSLEGILPDPLRVHQQDWLTCTHTSKYELVCKQLRE